MERSRHKILPSLPDLAADMRKDDRKRLILFRKNLKRLRIAKGWSLRDLAAETGLDHSLLGKYESGARQPVLATVYKLIDALEVEPGELLT